MANRRFPREAINLQDRSTSDRHQLTSTNEAFDPEEQTTYLTPQQNTGASTDQDHEAASRYNEYTSLGPRDSESTRSYTLPISSPPNTSAAQNEVNPKPTRVNMNPSYDYIKESEKKSNGNRCTFTCNRYAVIILIIIAIVIFGILAVAIYAAAAVATTSTIVIQNERKDTVNWTAWGPFSQCDVTCGTGTVIRERSCQDPDKSGDACIGTDIEMASCLIEICGATSSLDSDSDDSPISVSTKSSPVTGNIPTADKSNDSLTSAITRDVPGNIPTVYWTAWGPFSQCDVTCGEGTVIRERSCQDPDKSEDLCIGTDIEMASCLIEICEATSSSVGNSDVSPTLVITKPSPTFTNMPTGDKSNNSPTSVITKSSLVPTVDSNHSQTSVTSKPSPATSKIPTATDINSATSSITKPNHVTGNIPTVGNSNESPTSLAITSSSIAGTVVPSGTWSYWSYYGECSVTCGQGVKERRRACSGTAGFCLGPFSETLICNEASCDTVSPHVVCPPNQDVTVRPGVAGKTVMYPPAITADNSGGYVSLSYSYPAGSFFLADTSTQVIVTATDPSGNTAVCVFTISITVSSTDDIVPPYVVCPPDQHVHTAPGENGTNVEYPPVDAFDDNHSKEDITVSYSHPSGSFFAVNQTTNVTISGVDLSGNTGTCSFTVSVYEFETTPPELTCPEDIRVYRRSVQYELLVPYPPLRRVTDNSGGAVSVTYDPRPDHLFRHTRYVYVTGTDPSGNTATCFFRILVTVDDAPPWIFCPDNQVMNVDQGSDGAYVTYPAATALDYPNSGLPRLPVKLSYTHPSGSYFYVGTTIVTVTATDNPGNERVCIFAVAINVIGHPSPAVLGCNPASSQLKVDRIALDIRTQPTQLNFTEPSADSPDTPVRTHNDFRSGSLFYYGITEIIYIFGVTGAEATCTFRIYIGGTYSSPCTSNPCTALSESLPSCRVEGPNYYCSP
ncbi:uncharacterized protein [Amphiura filiformis]|uniref:uncharacterized protein n=1 Tax=Amphiura filiformis TaxID=82378 RepID=UPI003B225B68